MGVKAALCGGRLPDQRLRVGLLRTRLEISCQAKLYAITCCRSASATKRFGFVFG